MKKLTLLILVFSFCGISYATGYVASPVKVHKYTTTHARTLNIPSSYDARKDDIVLPARDQKTDGTCWAFSTCDALQTLYAKNGLKKEYLSPQAFATCFTGFEFRPIVDGGNSQIAGSMLARLEGIVLESALPYDYTNSTCQTYSKEDTPAYTLGWINLPEGDATAIKEAIMKYGSVTCSYYHENKYYNNATNTYEYIGSNTSNHGVSIIGWDDSKGAWLVKNTWGNHLFDEGCIWVSYKDSKIAQECTAYTDVTPTDSIDHVYHYSTSGMTATYGTASTNKRINGYTKHHFATKQQITYIGTYNFYEGTKAVFFVRGKNKQMLYESEPVTMDAPGFYKHTLKEPIVVEGEVEICVGYESSKYSYVIPIEMAFPNFNTIELHPNTQWLSFEGSEAKTEVSTSDNQLNLCIYAYTMDYIETDVKNTYANKQVYNGKTINPEVWNDAIAITLYNIVGKEVATLTPGDTTLPNLLTGIYIIKVTWNDGSYHAEKACIQ